jgi:hypothetical protein
VTTQGSSTSASSVTRLAIDETASARPRYVTLFVDIDQARVVFATEGKDADTIASPMGATLHQRRHPEDRPRLCRQYHG